MPEFAYMIDVQWVKDNSPIDDNVDPKLLRNAMRTSQDGYIRDLIGSGLYDEILTQINASTLSANNQTLINQYIAPCLLHYIISEATVPMTFKFMNKSISTRTSDNSNPIDIDQLTTIANHYKNKAEYYANRLTAHLMEYSTTYPLYLNAGSGIDTIHPSSTTFFSGIYLGETKCRDYEEPED
jgi:hypothetical protein